MPREIPKAYEPKEIEERWAKAWFDEKLFRPEASNPDAQTVFSIALPPPNVTGSIHIGHMLEHTQIDMLVRWHRMRGERTLWLPGMDHAGIGTQFVVERMLAKEGLRRQDLGREEFERRVWKWKEESGGQIKSQMIRLGASCDWTREKFTLEPALYRAVLEAFLRLYREGLIYRGRYMVNWCPRCLTAISDLEVVHHERVGQIWYLRYPIAPGSLGGRSGIHPERSRGSSDIRPSKQEGALAPEAGAYLVVATTRPETMLGDTAVAVHPDDDRYKHLVGKKVLLPLMNREIPIIADTYVDREFGTGAVKITPAHDANDFELGRRHHLQEIDVIAEDGHMNEAAGKYSGLDRFVARARIIEDLAKLGLIERIAEHTHAIGTCDRCKSIVEPRISTQWFCKMKPLAEPAHKVVSEGLVEVVPDNQRTILLQWLENIRDWCISRQLWWGHRIPIWHCAECKEMVPATDSSVELFEGHARAAGVPTKCPKCGSARLEQDKDVLDTWFSSALWPFSTLGWPDDTADLRTYYPTSLLISGYDILFFWDARMIMMGLHLSADRFPNGSLGGRSFSSDISPAKLERPLGPEGHPEGLVGHGFSRDMNAPRVEGALAPEAPSSTTPFHRLYLHSLVRLAGGEKMSKTKGTGVDPLQMIQQYGTDALRFMLTSMAAPGTDIILSEDRILSARAFANKIWNASRFLFVNLEKVEAHGVTLDMLASPEIRARAPYLVNDENALIHDWIFARLSAVAGETSKALHDFQFHEACKTIYQFFWGDFCDWYIEWVKPQLTDANREVALAAWRNIFSVLEAALRLLHPVMPFLTEELWHKLPKHHASRSIAFEHYPEPRSDWDDRSTEQDMATLQEIIIAARNIRAEMKVDQKRKVAADFSTTDEGIRKLVEQNLEPVLRLAALSELHISSRRLDSAGGSMRSTAQFDLRIAYREGVDKAAEIAKAKKEIERLAKDIESKQSRLADEAFLSKAPPKIVDDLRATLAARQIEHQKLVDRLKQLDS
jgi:valyl-tRNA synthetase